MFNLIKIASLVWVLSEIFPSVGLSAAGAVSCEDLKVNQTTTPNVCTSNGKTYKVEWNPDLKTASDWNRKQCLSGNTDMVKEYWFVHDGATYKPDCDQFKGGSGTAQLMASNCAPQIQNEMNTCKKNHEAALKACNEDTSSFMNQAKSAGTQMANLAAQMTAAQQACSGMQALAAGGSAALAYFQSDCTKSREACLTSCDKVEIAAEKCIDLEIAKMGGVSDAALNREPAISLLNSTAGNWQGAQDDCNGFVQQVQDAQQSINNTMGNLLSAMNCKKNTNANNFAGPPNPNNPNAPPPNFDFCKQNPTSPACKALINQNCNNAEFAASNLVCRCMKNPNDPACRSLNNNGGINNGGAIGAVSPKGSTLGPPDFGLGGGGNSDPEIQQGTPHSGEGGESIGGRQGGAANLGNGGMAGGGDSDSGGGGGGLPMTDPTAVHNGFYSGSGGGFGSGNNGPGTGGGPGGLGSGSGKSKVNLAKFLPNKMSRQRKVLGSSGKGSKIYGPNENIWERINNRYNIIKPTLKN